MRRLRQRRGTRQHRRNVTALDRVIRSVHYPARNGTAAEAQRANRLRRGPQRQHTTAHGERIPAAQGGISTQSQRASENGHRATEAVNRAKRYRAGKFLCQLRRPSQRRVNTPVAKHKGRPTQSSLFNHTAVQGHPTCHLLHITQTQRTTRHQQRATRAHTACNGQLKRTTRNRGSAGIIVGAKQRHDAISRLA